MEDILKQAVNLGAVENSISSRSDRFTESQKFPRNIAGHLMRTPSVLAAIAKLLKRYAEIAVMKEEMFYDSRTNVAKEREDWIS